MSIDDQPFCAADGTFYHIESIGNDILVTLSPEVQELGWADTERIGEELRARIKAETTTGLLIDLSAFSGLDSLSVAVLVRFWKSIQEYQGTMVVISGSEVVNDVLHMAGLDKVLTVAATRDEGLRALESAAWEKRPFALPAALGLVAVLTAAAGLSLPFVPVRLIAAEVAIPGGLGCAVLAAGIGGMIASRESGGRRGVGLVVVVCSLGLLGVGLFHVAERFGVSLALK